MRMVLSLGKARAGTLLLFGALFTAWLICFIVKAPIVWLWVFTCAQHAHMLGMWWYFIWQFTRPSTRVYQRVTLLRPVLLFVATVLAMSALHATILRSDAAAYAGIPAGTDAWGELGVGAFLAIETMATLGSGTIPARTAPSLAAVAYNCIASLAYSLFAFGLFVIVLGARIGEALVDRWEREGAKQKE